MVVVTAVAVGVVEWWAAAILTCTSHSIRFIHSSLTICLHSRKIAEMEGIFSLDDKASASRITQVRAAVINGAAEEKKFVKKRAKIRHVHMHWIPLLQEKPTDCDEAVLALLVRWLVEKDLLNISAQDLIHHISMEADEIRESLRLPKEYQERFDVILDGINAKLYAKKSAQTLQTPRASNVSAFSFDSAKRPSILPDDDAHWFCLQLAEFFSSPCGNAEDTVGGITSDPAVATLSQTFDKVMAGLLPFFAILENYEINADRKTMLKGGFGIFITAEKKENAPPHFPGEVGIKAFRTDVDQPTRMICNEMLLMKEACINRLFPTVYAFSFDSVLLSS